MHIIKGFVCVLERDNHGVCIYGRSDKILEFDPLEFECFETVSAALPRLNRSLTYTWNERGYVAHLELEIPENETDEFQLGKESSLVVFWKSWFEADRRYWRIAGLSGGNALLSLEPYGRSETALRKLRSVRDHRGEALLASWSFKTVFDPLLDGTPVIS